MLVNTSRCHELKFSIIAVLGCVFGLALWGVLIPKSYARSQVEIDAACGEDMQTNLDEFPVERIERCLRAKGFDPFNSQGVGVHADFPCERAIWADSGLTHSQSDKFCKKVADAHEIIYGYRPYWDACGHPDSVSEQSLKACARGFFRQYDQWERPSSTLYDRETNCNSALAVYRNGYSNGHLGFAGKIYDVKEAGDRIGCDRMRRVIASLIPYESDPCYADKFFYQDRLGFFSQCMASDIQSDSSCQQIRQRYVDKLITANGGLPHNLTPYDQQIPICSEILALRLKPFAENIPVTLPQAEAPPEISMKTTATGGVPATLPPLRQLASSPFTVYVLFSLLVSFGFVLFQFRDAFLTPSGRQKVWHFFERITFQFHPNVIAASLFGVLGFLVIYVVAIALSILPWYGLAQGFQVDKPLLSALYVNFLIFAPLSIANVLFTEKKGLPLFRLFHALKDRLPTGNELGKQLVAEAVTRNYAVLYIFALLFFAAFSSASTAWAIRDLFGFEIVESGADSFRAYFGFFADLVFQTTLLELPRLAGIGISVHEFNTDSKLAGLYVIFTKAVIIGNLVDLVWRSWSEIKGIYVHVNGSIQAQLESISAKAQPFKDIPAIRFRLRKSVAQPFEIYFAGD